MDRVLAVCAVDNAASVKTIERCGGAFEAISDRGTGPALCGVTGSSSSNTAPSGADDSASDLEAIRTVPCRPWFLAGAPRSPGPFVSGAASRIAVPYDDPKSADGTSEETARYDERVTQIGRDMAWVFSVVRGRGSLRR